MLVLCFLKVQALIITRPPLMQEVISERSESDPVVDSLSTGTTAVVVGPSVVIDTFLILRRTAFGFLNAKRLTELISSRGLTG